MARSFCVAGASGSGKSTSIGKIEELGIQGVDPKITAIINVVGKPLPFRGSRKIYDKKISEGGNYASVSDAKVILKILKNINDSRPDIKNVIIDDSQYIMADEFMSKALKKGYDKFNEIGKHMYDVILFGMRMRDDINFILLTHSEVGPDGNYKMKTIGKMLDDKVDLQGLFTVMMFTMIEFDTKEKKAEFYFVTSMYMDNVGIGIPAKTPIGMFKDTLIKNDLGLVLKTAEEFYN